MSERTDLIESLARHRGFLLHTARGLTDEQARTRSTVSALTIASLLKHVADTEEQWMDFARRGAEAMNAGGDVDWEAVASGEVEFVDTRFVLTEDDTLEHLRARIAEVASATEQLLAEADLDQEHPLPEAPWFEPGAAWSVRRVALHCIAEISQHSGHADIIREAIDGQLTMG
jgi:hypothetical protein